MPKKPTRNWKPKVPKEPEVFIQNCTFMAGGESSDRTEVARSIARGLEKNAEALCLLAKSLNVEWCGLKIEMQPKTH